MVAGLAPAGIANSPAFTGSPLASSFARSRKPSEEPIRPSSASLSAVDVSVAPDGTTKLVALSGPAPPYHPAMNQPAAPSAASTRMATRTLQPRFMTD